MVIKLDILLTTKSIINLWTNINCYKNHDRGAPSCSSVPRMATTKLHGWSFGGWTIPSWKICASQSANEKWQSHHPLLHLRNHCWSFSPLNHYNPLGKMLKTRLSSRAGTLMSMTNENIKQNQGKASHRIEVMNALDQSNSREWLATIDGNLNFMQSNEIIRIDRKSTGSSS